MVHCRAGECSEFAAGMAALARNGPYRNVIRWNQLQGWRSHVEETETSAMTGGTPGGDALMVHRIDAVVRRIRMAQRAGLCGRYMVGRQCHPAGRRERGSREVAIGTLTGGDVRRSGAGHDGW